ncbi:hypothetical protein PG993_003758 [Apiospora rasikravindrae]|uniref:Uncharacterized protein n=1 Tax=Apiospora rasikravindrae TaxID=990691 RepID=A0ABR1U0N1_9PEZI
MSNAGHSQHPGNGSQLILHPSQSGAQHPSYHSTPQANPQSSAHSSHAPSADSTTFAGVIGHPTASQAGPQVPGRGSRHVHFASPDPGSPTPSSDPSAHPGAGQSPFNQYYVGQGRVYNYNPNSPPPAQPPFQQPPAPPAYPYPYYQQYGGGGGGGGGGGLYYRVAPAAAPAPAAVPAPKPRIPARWQTRPVEVVVTNKDVFHCNRQDILFHFPATRQDPFGRRLYPHSYLAPPNRTPASEEGLKDIFRCFEDFRLRNVPVRLFDRAADILDRGDNARQAYYEACTVFVGICTALDKEWGLGASDDLLQQIDEFVMVLMEGYDAAWNSPRLLVDLLNTYSQVFQPSSLRHVQTVRGIWRAVPSYARSAVAQSMWGRTATAPKTSSRSAFVRILRDMSLY